MHNSLECYENIGLLTKLIQTDKDSSVFELYNGDKFIGIITMNQIQNVIMNR